MKSKPILIQFVVLAIFIVLISASGSAHPTLQENLFMLQEEYRVTGYKKGFNGWEKVPLRIRVTAPQYGGKEKIEVVAYQTSFGWQTVTYCFVHQVNELLDGKEIAANFEYKASCAGTVYFNF
ncbi:hypothetical protein [Thermoflexibacter ruber]|uniref:Uncharacterized protein n=1 Tax=Thermoflexibacter ruber TaxID=1003 RepID=A0A1I2KA19_9BACT|nr:hypothetical protein [Thermoflexibacter ruber]SFF62077.1 hypothetical protein SAMN04488541_10873 [Thermoflexibacter ruber]